MSGSKIGYGATLEFANGASPAVWTKVAEVTHLGGIQMSASSVDVTHMESPDDAKEFIAGLIDGGEVPIEGNFLPSNATQDDSTGLISIFKSRETRDWRMTLPGGEIFSFSGFLQNVGFDVPMEDKMPFTASVKISGLPTLV